MGHVTFCPSEIPRFAQEDHEAFVNVMQRL